MPLNSKTVMQVPPTSRSDTTARNFLRDRPRFLNLRRKSLLRANLLVIFSLVTAFLLSDFPRNRATLWLILPAVISLIGTAETVRCLRPRWSFYHAGVVLFCYMDLMAVSMILFMLLYPYARWISAPR